MDEQRRRGFDRAHRIGTGLATLGFLLAIFIAIGGWLDWLTTTHMAVLAVGYGVVLIVFMVGTILWTERRWPW